MQRRERPTRGFAPWLALGLLLFFVGISPIIIWNAREDWPTVAHLLGHLGLKGGDMPVKQGDGHGFHYNPLWTLGFIGTQLGMIGPVLLIAGRQILVWRRSASSNAPDHAAERFLIANSVPIITFYLLVSFIAEPEGNWPLAGYLTLFPLAARRVSPYEALVLIAVLMLAALVLVLQLDELTIRLSLVAAGLAISYPFVKRFFPAPQLYLGIAFGWGVPMAFAATTGGIPKVGWLVFLVTVLWAGIYDTLYAMVDRDDDLLIGIRSTAILFGDMDRVAIGIMQLVMVWGLVLVGQNLDFSLPYYAGVVAAALLRLLWLRLAPLLRLLWLRLAPLLRLL
jgi:hypothetical protein